MSLAGIAFTELMDANSSFYGGELVYYRTKNFTTENNNITDIGLIVEDANAAPNNSAICPAPQVNEMSNRNISDAQTAGVIIRAGAKAFQISNTWVYGMQQAKGFATPEQVFDDDSVVGLVYNNILYEIASRSPSTIYSDTTSWTVIGNGTNLG